MTSFNIEDNDSFRMSSRRDDICEGDDILTRSGSEREVYAIEDVIPNMVIYYE